MARIDLVEHRALAEPGYDMTMSEWRAVVGYEGFYEVSEEGVRSLPRTAGNNRTYGGRVLAPHISRYVTYHLSKGGKATTKGFHVLLAEAFLGPRPEGQFVLHRDDDRTNNSLENLYYGTPSQNNYDQVTNGIHRQTKKTHCPRRHELAGDNLRPDALRNGMRTCKACRDGRNIRRTRPDLDLQVVSDACYREIMFGEPNPYRRSVSDGLRASYQEGGPRWRG